MHAAGRRWPILARAAWNHDDSRATLPPDLWRLRVERSYPARSLSKPSPDWHPAGASTLPFCAASRPPPGPEHSESARTSSAAASNERRGKQRAPPARRRRHSQHRTSMPRGAGRLDVKRVNANTMERACRDPANLRVGATNDPLSRARQYEQHGANGAFFVGQFLYCEVRKKGGRGRRPGELHTHALVRTMPPLLPPHPNRHATPAKRSSTCSTCRASTAGAA